MKQSKTWDKQWSGAGSIPLYHLRVGLILRNMDVAGLRTLEVGCGSAADSLQLALKGARTTCLDFSPRAIRLARRLYKKYGVSGDFILGDGFNLGCASSSFDIVFNAGVIEHYKDPSKMIKEMKRVSKKYIMIWVPQKYHPYSIKKHVRIKQGTWEFGWETEYSYRELKKLMERFDLKIIDSLGSAPGIRIPKLDYYLKKYIGRWIGLEVGVLCKR